MKARFTDAIRLTLPSLIALTIVACVSGRLTSSIAAQPSVDARASSPCDEPPRIPTPPKDAKIFSREGSKDDTASLQLAINNLKHGEWLVFPPGIYSISKHLAVPVNGVTLYGQGATIHSTNPTDGALMIQGDNVAVYGLTLTQDTESRQSTPWAGGISAFDARTSGARRRIQGLTIRGNTIRYSAGAGIFVYKVNGFTIANNTIYRSLADGIHMTAGSTNGRVVQNVVSQSGDDMIAIVSYAGSRNADTAAERYKYWSPQDNLDRNIYVAGNRVSDQYWGRGIAVVGGSDITIESNDISRTAVGAGIYLTREKSYATFGDHNVLVAHNSISDVQTLPPTYKPANISLVQTHQGAIELGAQLLDDEVSNPTYRQPLALDAIAIVDNTVHGAHYAGIRIGVLSPDSTISNLLIERNDLANVGSNNIVQVEAGLDKSSIACSNNRLDGVVWASQCSTGVVAVRPNFSVTGASLVCEKDGSVHAKIP